MKEMKDFKSKVEILKNYGFKRNKNVDGSIYYKAIFKDEFFGNYFLEVHEDDMKYIYVYYDTRVGSVISLRKQKFEKLEWILEKFAKLKQ